MTGIDWPSGGTPNTSSTEALRRVTWSTGRPSGASPTDGHEVVIETHYRITIDGTEFKDHLTVDPNGSVHYHGLPQYSAPSAVDVMKAIVSRLSVGDRPAPLESGQPVHDGHGGH